jgi:hypothetical protein
LLPALVKRIERATSCQSIDEEYEESIMGMNAKQRRVNLKHRKKQAKFRARRREEAQVGGAAARPVATRRTS